MIYGDKEIQNVYNAPRPLPPAHSDIRGYSNDYTETTKRHVSNVPIDINIYNQNPRTHDSPF